MVLCSRFKCVWANQRRRERERDEENEKFGVLKQTRKYSHFDGVVTATFIVFKLHAFIIV